MEKLFWDTPTPEEKKPEDMTEKELLLQLFKKVGEIHDFMAVLKHNYDEIVSTIEIDSMTLKELVNMSERTICRWRSMKKIPYHVRPDGFYYYKFEELYAAVKSGSLDGKNFDRIGTLSRMKAYYYGWIKKHNNIVEWGSDENDVH